MTRPTVSQAGAWQPEALHRLADEWDSAARRLSELPDGAEAAVDRTRDDWTGAAADEARRHAQRIASEAASVVTAW